METEITKSKTVTGIWVLRESLWEKTNFLAELEANDVNDLREPILNLLIEKAELSERELSRVRKSLKVVLNREPSVVESGVALFNYQIPSLKSPIQILVRLKSPIHISGRFKSRFVWILLSSTKTHPFISSVAEFFKLMNYRWFRKRAIKEQGLEGIFKLYREGLHRALNFKLTMNETPEVLKPFEGMMSDLKSRSTHYINDFTCGFNLKVLASIIFMFFACAAPAIAFGALVDTFTGGQIGVIETIVATAACGVLWAIFGGQPLMIIGPTGPNIVFTGILYQLCMYLKLPFLSTSFWVGMWTMVFLFLLAIFNASTLIRFFTRFTDEIFAALISSIFIVEALNDIFGLLSNPDVKDDSALLSLLLASGTFAIAIGLSRMRRTPYLREKMREFLSDFGPAIALFIMTYVAFLFPNVVIQTLNVPTTFQTTMTRSWIVDPFLVPSWVLFGAALPAALLTILIWVNQNITARLVQNSDHQLRKGTSYHWDIFVAGALVGMLSIFGLPWVVGAAVRSINHVRSLLVTRNDKPIYAVENRISNLGVHLFLGISLLLLPTLKAMPMSVLYGMFLFMGVGSLGGNQFISRLKLWFVDPNLFDPTHHLRAVPIRTIHLFTSIQLVCLGSLWIVKQSFLGILFPLFVALLVPVRILLARFIQPEYVALLDLEESPEKFRDFGV
jgi:hypothetical protein